MLGISFAKKTVTHLRPQWVNDHGAMVPDWSVPADAAVFPLCSVQPGSGSSDVEHRDGKMIAFTVLLPDVREIGGRDRLRFDGHDYPVIGVPLLWDQLPRLTHWQVSVGRWEDIDGQ